MREIRTRPRRPLECLFQGTHAEELAQGRAEGERPAELGDGEPRVLARRVKLGVSSSTARSRRGSTSTRSGT
jgi:hypothetical protein